MIQDSRSILSGTSSSTGRSAWTRVDAPPQINTHSGASSLISVRMTARWIMFVLCY